MHPIYNTAEEAAKIVRQYITGEKKLSHSRDVENEIFDCACTLQEWRNIFKDEYQFAQRIASENYHREEASVGLL